MKDAKKVKAKMMKERWGMMNRVTAYISQNQEWWEMEKREREDERSRRMEEWDKMERYRKIKMLKENIVRKKVCKEEKKNDRRKRVERMERDSCKQR